jgi:hypothetical protein
MSERVYEVQGIRNLLSTNNRAVERAIVVLYERQTEDEKHESKTRHLNGVGFSGAHSRLGSYYARWILSGKSLGGKHLVRARAIVLRYCGQLCDIANQRLIMRATSNV